MARKHRKGDGNSAQGVANHSFQSFERSKAICRSSLYPDIEHVHLFSDNVHAVRRACAASITDVMDALKIDDFKDELLPSLISLYNSSGNYQIQSNLLYTFQNVLLSPLLSSNQDWTTEIQTLLIKELSVFIEFPFVWIESNSQYSIHHLQGDRQDIRTVYSRFPEGICSESYHGSH